MNVYKSNSNKEEYINNIAPPSWIEIPLCRNPT